MKIKTLCIFGTCPEAVKMAPVIRGLELDPRFHNQIGIIKQCPDQLESVLDLYHLQPHHQWDIQSSNLSISRLSAKILVILTELFEQNRPDYVLVVGNTVTALTAALAAYYCRIPIGHIEAGLRIEDFDGMRSHEANRKFVGHLADVHFAPTFTARHNLLREGMASESVYVTGSTTIDALFEALAYIRQHPNVQVQLRQQFSYLNPTRRMILITGPRYTSDCQQGLPHIGAALKEIAQQFPEIDLVYPIDLNLRASLPLNLPAVKNIFLIEPVDYLAHVYLMQTSYFIITDSGGIQEEAPCLGKPVLLLRDKTERPEALEAGTVILVGTETDKIVSETTRLLKSACHYQQMSQAVSPYGDGKAGMRIVETLAKYATRGTNQGLKTESPRMKVF